MMNLIARSNERAPSALSSTASESPGKTRHESQSPLSTQAEKHDRTGRPVVCSQRASQTRFSREHKNVILEEEENHDRTGRPVVCPQGRGHHFVIEIEDDETESELSLGSRSFLHKVNDQVRKKKTILNTCNRRQRRTFCDMGNVHVFNIASICIHGEEYSDNWHSIKNTEDLTMKQMFDISEKLVSEQSDEIYGV